MVDIDKLDKLLRKLDNLQPVIPSPKDRQYIITRTPDLIQRMSNLARAKNSKERYG